VVQEILGHSQIAMTMDIYSHVMPSMHEDAMKRLNDTIERQKKDGEDPGSGAIVQG
jgi:integrase